jgi:hypothetical protein
MAKRVGAYSKVIKSYLRKSATGGKKYAKGSVRRYGQTRKKP